MKSSICGTEAVFASMLSKYFITWKPESKFCSFEISPDLLELKYLQNCKYIGIAHFADVFTLLTLCGLVRSSAAPYPAPQ